MTKQSINIQDGFLVQCLKVDHVVTIEMTTGRSVAGKLKRFDRFALLVESEGHEILIYKHAIATISMGVGES